VVRRIDGNRLDRAQDAWPSRVAEGPQQSRLSLSASYADPIVPDPASQCAVRRHLVFGELVTIGNPGVVHVGCLLTDRYAIGLGQFGRAVDPDWSEVRHGEYLHPLVVSLDHEEQTVDHGDAVGAFKLSQRGTGSAHVPERRSRRSV